jgi:hypothetical protein
MVRSVTRMSHASGIVRLGKLPEKIRRLNLNSRGLYWTRIQDRFPACRWFITVRQQEKLNRAGAL